MFDIFLGYRMVGVAGSAMSSRAAEVGSKGEVLKQLWLRDVVRQSERSNGTQKLAYVSQPAKIITVFVSHDPHLKRHATARDAQTCSFDACIFEGAGRGLEHPGRGLN